MEKANVYQTIFQLFNCALDTFLRNIQYKIVIGVLLTNNLLVKY